MSGNDNINPVLLTWMRFILRFAGTFNLLAGLGMICLYHEGFKAVDLAAPKMALPVQVMGILVALFGVGYFMVAARPERNRDLLLLGMLSKAISSVFALAYVGSGQLPWHSAVVVLFSDIIYVPLFWIIWRRLCRLDTSY